MDPQNDIFRCVSESNKREEMGFSNWEIEDSGFYQDCEDPLICLLSVRVSTLTETANPGQTLWQLFTWVVLWSKILVKNMELIRHHRPEEFRKGQKEKACVWPPPRILVAGNRLGWAMWVPPGRILNQNDWPKTTWNESHLCSVQSLSRVQLFATPWTAACKASLSISCSQSRLKLMSIESVMPSNHLILCHPLLLPSIFPSIKVFPMSRLFTSGGQTIGVSASSWKDTTKWRYFVLMD